MQSASANFDKAAKSAARVLAEPSLQVDWANDGFQSLKTKPYRDPMDNRRRTSGWGPGIKDYPYNFTLFNEGTFDVTRFNVDASGGHLTVPAPLAYSGVYLTDYRDVNYDIVARVADWGVLPTGNYLEPVGIMGRGTTSNAYYLYRAQIWTTGEMTCFMFDPALGTQIGFNVNIDRWWHPGEDLYLRACAIGTTHMMKVWSSATPEPQFWDVVVTNSAYVGEGFIGIRSGISSGNTNGSMVFTYKEWHNYAIDEMSDQLGQTWSVSHQLDDGMPDDVSNGAGSSNFGQFSADLTGRKSRYYGGSPESAGRYFSQFNDSSPVSNFDRDIPPIALDAGFRTASGQERVRVFTGQMADIATDERNAALTGVSGANRKLQKLIQPPPIIASQAGLTSSWPVSYALSQCGLYVSPPPRPKGCMLWMPMHGSLQPMVGGIYRSSHQHDQKFSVSHQYAGDAAPRTGDIRPAFVDGPFLEANWNQVKASHKQYSQYKGIALEYTNNDNIFCQQGSKGRLEFWAYGDDTADTSNPPGGAGSIPYLIGFELLQTYNSKTMQVVVGLTTAWRPFVSINDGTAVNTRVYSAGPAVPQDAQWHFVGIAWDMVTAQAWMKWDAQVEEHDTSIGWTTANLPPFDIMDDQNPQQYPQFTSYIPVAEVQVTSGTPALPANAAWLNDPNFYWNPANATVVMTPGQNRSMVALAETQPIRAADLINRFAKAELAMTRMDELDRFNYLPMPYWAKTAQQTVADTYAAKTNIVNMQAYRDLTRVRNSVSLSYKQLGVTQLQNIYNDSVVRYIAPGRNIIRLNFANPVVYVNADNFLLMSASPISNPLPLQGFLSLNTQPDGSGTAWQQSMFVTINEWDPGGLTLQIDSLNLGPLWLVRADGGPVIGIAGQQVVSSDAVATAVNQASIDQRGERGLTIAYDDIQESYFAQTMATELASRLAFPRWRVDNLEIVGDHRRQPGDLVRIQDVEGTALDGLGRVLGITHRQSGASYTQTVNVVEAWTTGVWDQSKWDQAMWGA